MVFWYFFVGILFFNVHARVACACVHACMSPRAQHVHACMRV